MVDGPEIRLDIRVSLFIRGSRRRTNRGGGYLGGTVFRPVDLLKG